MPISQTTALGTGMGVLIFTTLFTIGYSIYMAVLNHKQAKVRDEVIKSRKVIEEGNKILADQEDTLLWIKEALEKSNEMHEDYFNRRNK